MVFNSLTFCIFFLILLPTYWLANGLARHLILFLAGLIFYGFWRVDFLAVLLFSIGFDYASARVIDSTASNKARKLFLIFSVTINLLLLCFFKYTYFFLDNINTALNLASYESLRIPFKIILPLGISFYTFHSLSYVVDVYRRVIQAERSFILFVDYVLFFPQLVAGPILRAREVIPQFKNILPLSLEDATYGIQRIFEGLFLKVVLADNIALLVDPGYQYGVQYLSAWDVWTLTVLFGFQIYFDFAGYSSMAIGIARLLGISFPENFNFPYLAYSPREFWKRWHISLSSWIRDYLYLPLLGRRYHIDSRGGLSSAAEGKLGLKAIFVLFSTWLIMGFWHGANWTFIFWGFWHTVLILSQRLLVLIVPKKLQIRLLGWVVTMPLIFLGWIPFRSPSLNDTFIRLGKIVNPEQYAMQAVLLYTWHVAAVLLLILTIVWGRGYHWREYFFRQDIITIPTSLIYWCVVTFLVFVYFRPISQFIYFQF